MKEENTEQRKEPTKKKVFDLQERFIEYAATIIKLTDNIPETKAGKHICSQILRSGTSPAPNYGEAQSAESTSDFIHKLKIALKELRETEVWLKIILRVELVQTSKLSSILTETDELIAILVKSIQTAKKNKERQRTLHLDIGYSKERENPFCDRKTNFRQEKGFDRTTN